MAQNESKKKGGKNAARGAREAHRPDHAGKVSRQVRNSRERKLARVLVSNGTKYHEALKRYLMTGRPVHKHDRVGTRFVFRNVERTAKRVAYLEKIRLSHLQGSKQAILMS